MRNRIVLGGCIAIVSFSIIASIASRALHFPYARASVGSFFILLAIGFIAGRMAEHEPARAGASTAAMAGLADASIGWAASWAIGPGRSVNGPLTPLRWFLTALIVVSMAALVGYVGGAVGGRSRTRVEG